MTKKAKIIITFLVLVSMFLISSIGMAAYKPTKEYSGTTISYYSFPHGPGYIKALDNLTKQFKKLTGINVETTIVPWGGGNRKILSAIAAGNAPDVIYTTPARALPIITFGDNVIEPLDKYVEKSNIKDEIIYSEALDNYNWYGKQYAIGHYGDPHELAINIDDLKKAGIDQSYIDKMTDPDKTWTWDDLLYIAKKATADTDGDGKIDQWGFGYPGGTSYKSPFLALYWNIGGKVVDVKGNVSIGDKEHTLPVLKLLDKLKEQGSLLEGCESLTNDDIDNAYVDGKVAITYGHPTDQIIAMAKKGKKHPELVPVYPPKSPTGKRGSFFAWNGVMMSASSDNKEAAWEFIKFLVTSDNYKKMIIQETGRITPVTSEKDINNLMDPAYQDVMKIGLNAAKKGWYLRHEPAHPASGRITRAYNEAVQNVLTDKQTPLEATKWLKKEAQKAVKETE